MKRLTAVVIGALALAAAPQDGKRELRYAFTKGDTFPYALKYAMGVRVDKVPEIFQGVLPEDLLDLKMEGLLDVKVTEVAADGSATLEGTWKKLTAKGHMLVNDIDFKFDADKKEEKAAKKEPAAPADPALDGVLNLEDQLARAVATSLVLTADALGRLKVKESGAKSQEIEGIFRSLNGMMGALPQEKIGKGDGWKDTTKVTIPAAAGSSVDVPIATENLYAADEDVKGGSCAVLTSKFKVGQVEKKKNDENNVFNAQFKTAGEGEGKTWFNVKQGRATRTQSLLKVRVNAVFPNPGGGDDIELNATVKMEQNGEIGK
ncbi:MAG TPA: hypothetical protein VF950_16540 [Planctomycetota bacterium]